MIIKWIRGQNFKSLVDTTIEFHNPVTWIKGQNADGKSTIAGMYLWLFFNVDYELNNNPSVRRKINGIPVDDVDVIVEACVEIDGVETTFKKVQKRTKKESDEVEDGVIVHKTKISDDNTYYVNDVPKTLKEFNARISDDIKVMLMCSHINAFLTKKPEEVRKYLFSKAEGVSDVDVARQNKNLAKLVPLLESRNAGELAAMNKKVKTDDAKKKPILEGQIQEVERNIALASEIDLAELELERNRIKEQIADLESKIADVSKIYEEQDNIKQSILQLRFDMNGLQMKANQEMDSKRSAIRRRLNKLDNQLKDKQNEVQANQIKANKILTEIENDNTQIAAMREKWKSESELEFDENTLVCQLCGQPLPEDRQEQIKADFEQNKQAMLDKLTEQGKELQERITKNHEEHDNLVNLIESQTRLIDELNRQIKETEQELANVPSNADISGTEEYKKMQEELARLNSLQKPNVEVDSERKRMQEELSGLRSELLECEKKIARADTSAYEERLEELRKDAVIIEQNITDAQHILDLLDELDKAKNGVLSDSINSLFKVVNWKLFDFNKSGNYASTCIPEINGMSIMTDDQNKASRFIGKLDICNSIQKLEGINIPIFLDDAEALDTKSTLKALELVDCQVILLRVTDDEELKIEE